MPAGLIDVYFWTAVLTGLGIGSVYALVALGFSFAFRTTGSFNFAQGQLVVFGSLFTYSLYVRDGLPAAIAAFVACLIVGAIGGLTERVAIWPLARRGDETLKWLMSTLGMSLLFSGAATRIWGTTALGVPSYLSAQVVTIGTVRVSTSYVLAFAFAIAIAFAIAAFQRFTLWGRIMRAVGDNRRAVQLAGINVIRLGFGAFALSGVLAGLAGFVIAPVTFADPTAGLNFVILAFAALTIGGFTSHWGALAGGWIVGIAESVGGTYLGIEYGDLVVFGVLFLILFVRPEGLATIRPARQV